MRDVGGAGSVGGARLAAAKAAPDENTRVGSTAVSFVWDTKLTSYVRTEGGRRILTASGAPVAKPNVLVQYCKVAADHADVDVNGKPSAFTESVGSGRVVLFRDGRRIGVVCR